MGRFSFLLFLLLTLILTVAILAPAREASAASVDDRLLRGTLALWERAACKDADHPASCSVAAPLPVSFLVDAKLTPPPAGAGPSVVYDHVFRDGNWRVRLTLIWVEKAPTGEADNSSYLVTQSSLAQTDVGEIASCSRYDKLSDATLIPVGACGGRWDEKIYGVSFQRYP